MDAQQREQGTFAERLRTATQEDHAHAEEQGFAQELLRGSLAREGYAALAAQHYFAYTALEEVGRYLTDDPLASTVLFPELFRVPALERDLTTLYGTDWRERITPTPATRTYVARIHQMAQHPVGYIVHHYTRYIGDLSGGQFIRKSAAQAYGFTNREGIEFYIFDDVPSLPKFKADYRSRLNSLRLDEPTLQQAIRETRLAYQLNAEVLADLGHVHGKEVAA